MKRYTSLAIALVCMVCASCARLDYESFNNYRIGGGHIDGSIEAIEIEWVRGNVDICYHDASTVEFYEDIHYADPDHNMFHWFDGRTLHLKFCSPYTSTAAVGKKTLTVLLPMESMCDLVEIETVSANINADLDSRRFRCETVSGDVSLLTLVNPSTIRIETVSGMSALLFRKMPAAAATSTP